jgi:hypothetical protein
LEIRGSTGNDLETMVSKIGADRAAVQFEEFASDTGIHNKMTAVMTSSSTKFESRVWMGGCELQISKNSGSELHSAIFWNNKLVEIFEG